MNKEELRNAYIAKGYKVAPISEWRKVDAIEDRVYYDLQVSDPDGKLFTAQVRVDNEGTDQEKAQGEGKLKEKPVSFQDAVTTFLREAEVKSNAIYSIVQQQVYPVDEAAVVSVYLDVAGKLVEKSYLVRRRDGEFDYKEIATP